jgi:hypothetical protein
MRQALALLQVAGATMGMSTSTASVGSAPSASTPAGFSWETLPVHWFSANATAQLSDTVATQIAARHSLAIINGQGHAYWADPVGAGAEDKMIEAGRVLYRASQRLGRPRIAVLAYFNSVLDWTAYGFHRWLAADPARFLCDVHGDPVVGRLDLLNNTLHVPDFSQPAVRARWLANVVNTSRQLDGVFIDQGKYCSPFACKDRPGVYPAGKLAAWAEGHWQMLLELRTAIPSQILILNNLNTTDFPAGFDHEYEHFNGSLPQLKALQDDAMRGRLAACHSTVAYGSTVPLFLLGAGGTAYFAAPYLKGDGHAPGMSACPYSLLTPRVRLVLDSCFALSHGGPVPMGPQHRKKIGAMCPHVLNSRRRILNCELFCSITGVGDTLYVLLCLTLRAMVPCR